MTFDKCAVFFDDGIHQVLYAVEGELTAAAESYIREGVPFLILNVEDLPPRDDRENWTFDYSNPSGHGKAN